MDFVEIMELIKNNDPKYGNWKKDWLILTSCNSLRLAMCDEGTEEPYPCFKAPNGDIIDPQGKGKYFIYSKVDMDIYQCNSTKEILLFVYTYYE